MHVSANVISYIVSRAHNLKIMTICSVGLEICDGGADDSRRRVDNTETVTESYGFEGMFAHSFFWQSRRYLIYHFILFLLTVASIFNLSFHFMYISCTISIKSKYSMLAEHPKGGGVVIAETLTNICHRMWTSSEIPEDWKNEVILPLPKTGDLTRCTNWRGISLLSIPGTLRPNQAGFRPGRSCCEKILSRQIVDKRLAWQKPILVNFIDFKKNLWLHLQRISVENLIKIWHPR